MIAASEPLEFIPRGRQAVEEHPGHTEITPDPQVLSENVLLQRMQNVNISQKEEHNEYWCVREIYEACNGREKNWQRNWKSTTTRESQQKLSKQKNSKNPLPHNENKNSLSRTDEDDYMYNFLVNSEEELYVMKNTAVWTKGLPEEYSVLPRTCFTCETPIKFAFFCNKSFVQPNNSTKTDNIKSPEEPLISICLIDQSSLRVYCNNGEDFLANLEFPVSKVWSTCCGILLEKAASRSVVQNHTIPMPRLFSLSHPLDEVCPVLNKPLNRTVSYFIEADYTIIFTTEDSDLLLLYDHKTGNHIISKIRKATEEEINLVSTQTEAPLSRTGISINASCNASHNSMKFGTGLCKNSTSQIFGKSNFSNASYASHISKFLSGMHSVDSSMNPLNRTTVYSPLNNLQSSIAHNSMSIRNFRRVAQSQPSKPIVPEMCVEQIWTENTCGITDDFSEISTKAFIHTDFVGETYLCYLLSCSHKLQLIRLTNYGMENLQIATSASTISANDAVVLPRMKMLVILDTLGNIVLYTGPVFISKVHIASLLVQTPTTPLDGHLSTSVKLANTPIPRRSSLLPSIQKQADLTFEEELHLLSPVHPLQPQFPKRTHINTQLRDPAGNRVTIVYPSGQMFRISLPLFNETKFISRCIMLLRKILNRNLFLQTIICWYTARNPPGVRDYSLSQEWEVFKNVLLNLMGCSEANHDYSSSNSFNAEEPKKRKKNSESACGSNEDWDFMQSVLNGTYDELPKQKRNTSSNIDERAPLFFHIPAIFYNLHLLYEDIKLDESMYNCLPILSKFLHQLSVDMQLMTYVHHYELDFPELTKGRQKICMFTEQHGMEMMHKDLLQVPAPSVYGQLEHILKNQNVLPYGYVDGINDLSRNVLQIVSLIMHGHNKMKNWIKPLEFPDAVSKILRTKRFISTNVERSVQVIQMLISMNINRNDIQRLPLAIHLIIAECLENSRLNPPVGCSPASYELILRSELVEHTKMQSDSINYNMRCNDTNMEDSLSARCPPVSSGISQMEASLDDGMDNIDTKLLSLRFPDDMRIQEVRRLLTSSDPVLIEITQSPGTSDHEFIEEQEKQLFALCTRTMTLPMGRGMFTLRTSIPTPTESMPIPKLSLSGKEPIKGATIEMQQIEFPANMNLWPTFHNGVAAGLKISPNAPDVDSTWIMYNKPKGQTDISIEHAGFLMALGLNGHLKALNFMSIYDYLVKCDEMTSVGLLLGISATHRGTMDITTTKLLSVHIESLLPATALELDIPQNIQVTALMGIGLVYQGTAKRHIAEILLQEIGRPPGPEMENSVERESYALTAGLSLGLVTLGQGESPAGLRDLQLPDTLHYYMVGGIRRTLTGSQKEKYKLHSFQVREGDNVNIDVTAPGATLALGLMFFNTSNRAVAQWMNPPDNKYLLDVVRPDLLLLRTISRGLIMWSEIKPTEDWLSHQFPESLSFDVEIGSKKADIDHEAVTQAYCNIIAGAGFCIGLKYAGTEHKIAFRTLRRTIKLFLSFPGKYVGEYAGRTTIENCLMVLLISISLVCTGSGDLEILRIIRYLRSRIGPQNPQVTYGSHMAIHMSLGLLFLGAGRFSIAKTPEAVAALVIAFFPKFPNHSNDNRYHLQAFRHLYVLAVEPRLFLPRDIDTKKLCLCNVAVQEIGKTYFRRLPMAPCILPELSKLKRVVVDDPSYWPICFERGRNWDQLLKALEHSACIDIKKRLGCLSHLEDPDRLKSLFAKTLTKEQFVCWEVDPTSLERFSSEPRVIAFTDRFLHLDGDNFDNEDILKQKQLTVLFHNAVVQDKMHVFPIYLSIFDLLRRIKSISSSTDIWQMKLIDLYMSIHPDSYKLVSKELIQSHVDNFKLHMEKVLVKYKKNLQCFISSINFNYNVIERLSPSGISQLSAAIIYYNLQPHLLQMVDLTGTVNYLRYIYEFKKMGLEPLTIFALNRIIGEVP